MRCHAAVFAACLLAACASGPAEIDGPEAPRSEPSTITRGYDLALVLGSGGPRGFAQLGVLKVLEEAGVRPDLIVGSSAGAIVGAFSASGLTAGEIEQRALALSATDVFDVDVIGRRLDGGALQRYVDAAIGSRAIEAMTTTLVVVATRADDGAAVAFTHGNAAAAIRASSAVPETFRPVRIRGTVYFDGDIAAPLPILLARALGARRVIAVDVSQNIERAPPPPGSPPDWTRQALDRRVIIERELPGADLVIAPPLPYITGFSEAYRRMAIATGEAAAREALPRVKALLRK